jgi:hypothetical protein
MVDFKLLWEWLLAKTGRAVRTTGELREGEGGEGGGGRREGTVGAKKLEKSNQIKKLSGPVVQ